MEPISERRGYEAKKAARPLWRKLAGAALATVLVLAVVGHNHGSGNDGDRVHYRRDVSRRASAWQPKTGTTWQINIRDQLDLSNGNITPPVEVFDIDMFSNNAETVKTLHDAGKKVVCYFSAGSYENWRPDKDQFNQADLGNGLVGWPGENWLNISSQNVRNIMAQRIKLAADRGCDAIDPDNVDGYGNDNGLGLTADDSISFVKFLAGEAAKYNMATGLKNAGDILPSVLDVVNFSVVESCVQFQECHIYSPIIQAGKPIFHIEYPDSAPNMDDAAVDNLCNSRGQDGCSTVMKLTNLNAWVEYCDKTKY
ncbi:Uncharacterized protein TCAP_04534 [Tolypocladium capitatum]|uniref:alpha-galactosidase n=1 Tax=Tolypocladium capitatum TaxID=45235 RepID=A0A2K3QDD8_9HYPO|nr:Uncharacterized protein TCAP_04534 [Tolypocladium capitatum]